MRKYLIVIASGLAIGLLYLSFTGGLAQQPPKKLNSYYFPYVSYVEPPRFIGPDGGSIVVLAIYPQDPQVMFAGTWGAGVFKSTNGGATWVQTNAGLSGLLINALAVDPKNPDVVY